MEPGTARPAYQYHLDRRSSLSIEIFEHLERQILTAKNSEFYAGSIQNIPNLSKFYYGLFYTKNCTDNQGLPNPLCHDIMSSGQAVGSTIAILCYCLSRRCR